MGMQMISISYLLPFSFLLLEKPFIKLASGNEIYNDESSPHCSFYQIIYKISLPPVAFYNIYGYNGFRTQCYIFIAYPYD